jgi:hypothetical protein
MSQVTEEYRVDQCENVYDENGMFFCKWNELSLNEKKTVKQNPFSAR